MQIRTILLPNKKLHYTLLKRRGQRQLALSVHSTGRVTVTTPKWVSLREIERFLVAKSAWLMKALQGLPEHSPAEESKRRKHYKTHKEEARTLVRARLAELNQHYGFVYQRISIRSNTSRWGSCSQIGNLNFDYRILFLKPHLRDYILVHELCHLREMNHGCSFWKLVEEVIPQHKMYRKQLAQIHR